MPTIIKHDHQDHAALATSAVKLWHDLPKAAKITLCAILVAGTIAPPILKNVMSDDRMSPLDIKGYNDLSILMCDNNTITFPSHLPADPSEMVAIPYITNQGGSFVRRFTSAAAKRAERDFSSTVKCPADSQAKQIVLDYNY